ncbi:EAL domain-containing protein [Pontibacillus yanchengensis]|uniref:EAL domain-containing protein n=2 Tax=Pontibacillus yanchengensis TaxID=462910 RepID=A0ACC7VBG3_9BACI|nr:EAL domain-containing protein [Pontibacillus yanchengensis]MYL34776.1 EAL domain-containing protein [Pontibacillus yanchengensis]MYL52238.1 EAL domain-containing protein [Pontibacillus yanchengensis]
MLNPSGYLSPSLQKWVLEHIQEAILFVNEEGEIIEQNTSACKLLEVAEHELTSIDQLFDFDTLRNNLEKQLLLEVKDGSKRYFQVKCLKFKEPGFEVYCLIFYRISLHEKVKETKRRLYESIQAGQEGMVLHDQGIIIDCDESFANMFGYTYKEMLQKSVYELVTKDDQYTLRQRFVDYPEIPYEMQGIRKDGSSIYVEIMAHPHTYDNKTVRGAMIRDITVRMEQRQQIEFMAYYDDLTDLPNRFYFLKTINEAIYSAHKNGGKFAVHFMDIDYFKQINDTMGYVFGDQLLSICAERLKKLLDENVFIARMGGDEFLILQRGVQTNVDAETFATKIINIFEEPIIIDDFELYTSVSIGISHYPEDGIDENELIKHADAAMNVIKQNNRNNYKVFESSISKDFKSMLRMETELRKAMKEQQFELHYQPQKDIGSERVVGLEALLRWNHPEKGYISPATFIPIAEKTSLILQIGNWVLHEACKQNKLWQDQGYSPVVVGVNLSAKQFHQADLVEQVSSVLQQTGLHACYLELEITESMAMSNEEDIIHTLKGLRELGVHVSIDDFGTGYSSLKYLSRFPVNKLKIDKAFIHENRRQNKAIIKSIIHMSHSLNMKVIAEGVETEEQLHFLQEEECDEMQGFYYSKPLPPTHVTPIFQFVKC